MKIIGIDMVQSPLDVYGQEKDGTTVYQSLFGLKFEEEVVIDSSHCKK